MNLTPNVVQLTRNLEAISGISAAVATGIQAVEPIITAVPALAVVAPWVQALGMIAFFLANGFRKINNK